MYNVLHVDNSPIFFKILRTLFEANGFKYVQTESMKNAISLINTGNIDLVISSWDIRDGSGEELVRTINSSQFKHIPVIIITSKDSLEERQKMFSLGVIDYILKDALNDQINNYIERLKQEDKITRYLRKMRIAVLDDSETALQVLRKSLQLSNIHNVDYYSDPQKLLHSEAYYSIFLVDITLPKISGTQLVLQIRKRFKDEAIIAISANEHYKVIANILSSGADDYILKPFDNSIFIARLKANARSYLLRKEVRKRNEELRQMAIKDSLTGLLNHSHIYARLAEEIKKSERYSNPLSIIMLDLDHFKNINDTYGHTVGDTVLKEVANIISSCMREIDMAGRYGGEEFLIVLPETGLDGATAVAERICSTVSEITFHIEGLSVSITGGVAQFEGEKAVELVAKADKLLYQAKRTERGTVAFRAE